MGLTREGDRPYPQSFRVPTGTAVVGVLIAGLVCLAPEAHLDFQRFYRVVYYALTNLCALRLKPENACTRHDGHAGLIGCGSLALFVEWRVLLNGMS